MGDLRFVFEAEVWVFSGKGAWSAVSLLKADCEEIAFFFGKNRGWGAVPVRATVGNTSWKTSVFPDKKSGLYFLPVKASVRKAEKIKTGDVIEVKIDILS